MPTPPNDRHDAPGAPGAPLELPDLTLFALADEIITAWQDDSSRGRAKLLASLRANQAQADALLGLVADDLHDAALDALIGDTQSLLQEQPQRKRVAEQRAPYGEADSPPSTPQP